MKINVTLPIYNEEDTLEDSVVKVIEMLDKIGDDYEIVIADNASTDGTGFIGKKLEKKYSKVKYLHLPKKGRGGALKKAWGESSADILSYMDIDLSTDINAFPSLVEECKVNDIVTGSRHLQNSFVDRTPKREFISRTYNLLVRMFLLSKLKDHQCGFKAAKKNSFMELLPKLTNDNWFWDTEMLILAQRNKMKVKEIPVKWYEDRSRTSKVSISKTTKEYLLNIAKLMFRK